MTIDHVTIFEFTQILGAGEMIQIVLGLSSQMTEAGLELLIKLPASLCLSADWPSTYGRIVAVPLK